MLATLAAICRRCSIKAFCSQDRAPGQGRRRVEAGLWGSPLFRSSRAMASARFGTLRTLSTVHTTYPKRMANIRTPPMRTAGGTSRQKPAMKLSEKRKQDRRCARLAARRSHHNAASPSDQIVETVLNGACLLRYGARPFGGPFVEAGALSFMNNGIPLL